MLELAIMGCGEVVRDLHAPALRRLRRQKVFRVVALIDPAAERARGLRRDFPEASVFTSPYDAFAALKVDATLVASPPGLHAEHILAALAVGSHVLAEKPMVTSSAAADEVVGSAERAGRVLAVGLWRRFLPGIAEVASIVRRGELGDVTFVYREGAPYRWLATTSAPFSRAQSGGGVLLDLGAHALDTLEQIVGALRLVGAEDDSLVGGVESNVLLTLEAEHARGRLQLSRDQALRNGLWITGRREELRVDLAAMASFQRWELGGTGQVVEAAVTWPADVASSGGRRMSVRTVHDCILLEWVGFARAILFGEAPAVDGRAARNVIKVIEDAYAHAGALDLPWLEPVQRDSQRRRHWRASR